MSTITTNAASLTTYRPANSTATTPTTTAATAPSQTSTASLSSTQAAPQAFAGNGVTNSQGHAARLALGSTDNLTQSGIGSVGSGNDACQAPAGPRIDARYDKTLKTDGSQPLTGKDTAGRLQDLEGVSQLDKDANGKIADENRCAASTVTAGVYYAKGADGVRELVKDMEAYNKKHNLGQNPNFGSKEFKERLKSGKLTKDDLNQVQENLHWMLMSRQDGVLEATGKPSGVDDGIGSNVLKDFVKNSSNTKKMFDDNGLTIAQVDTDKDGKGNHFVLAGQQDGNSFVYDPFSIKGGDGKLDQVTFDRDQLRVYRDSISAQDNNQKYVYSSTDVPASAN